MDDNDKLELRPAVFEELVGRDFTVVSEEDPVRLTLTRVNKLQPATNRTDLGIRQDPFSLQFKEVTDFQPSQKTYTVRTESGAVELFLVPIGFGEYEAVFN